MQNVHFVPVSRTATKSSHNQILIVDDFSMPHPYDHHEKNMISKKVYQKLLECYQREYNRREDHLVTKQRMQYIS